MRGQREKRMFFVIALARKITVGEQIKIRFFTTFNTIVIEMLKQSSQECDAVGRERVKSGGEHFLNISCWRIYIKKVKKERRREMFANIIHIKKKSTCE